MENVKISIDKIKLSVAPSPDLKLKVVTYEETLLRLQNAGFHVEISLPRFSINSYRNSAKIQTPKGNTLFLAWHWNGGYEDSKQKPEYASIEFNPNKDAYAIWRLIAEYMLLHVRKVCKYDIAIDIPNKRINDVYITTQAEQMHYIGNGAVTLYIAPKEKASGRIKIYDKTKERAKVGETIPQTLRVEATAKVLDEHTVQLRPEELARINRHIQDITLDPETYGDTTLEMLLYIPPHKREAIYAQMAKATRAKYRKLIREASEAQKLPLITPEILSHLLSEYQQMTDLQFIQNFALRVSPILTQTTEYPDLDTLILKTKAEKLFRTRLEYYEKGVTNNDKNISIH